MSGDADHVRMAHVDLKTLQRLAEALHKHLPFRVVVGLRGTLGAGKTRFVQCFARAAGIAAEQVTSPTFPIVQHYQGDRDIQHIDAYRLADEDEFIELGGEELLEESETVFIEWPDRIAACLPANLLMLDLAVEENDQWRTITATCPCATILATVKSAFGDTIRGSEGASLSN